MDYHEVQQAIHDVSKIRMPDFAEDIAPKAKIEALEGHLFDTARARQLLEEARLMLEDAYEVIDDEWLGLTGWEVYLRGKPKSQVEIDEAKREMKPDLFFSRRRCQKLLRQVGNQIRRMEKDDAVASRAYTMLVGA